jgi:peroxiredoxin
MPALVSPIALMEAMMALTSSTMLLLNTAAPDFHLLATDGKYYSLASFSASPLLLVMFICNHCPFVKHVRKELAALGRDYQHKGVAMLAINSNDTIAYPADDMAHMQQEVQLAYYSFPYVLDDSQAVAKAYDAACTPDFYLFDKTRKLIYRGQLDDSRPSNGVPVTGKDLRAAIELGLANAAPVSEQKPSMGCNIKWRAVSDLA